MNHSDSTVNGLSVINPVDIHASLLQRPSVTNVVDNMHVLNVSDNSFNFGTSPGNNHNHSNQFSDMTISSDTLSNDIMRSVTQESQQVSDHLNTLSDTHLSSATSVSSNESLSVLEDSLQASISVSQSTSNNALNLGLKDKGFRIGHLNIQGLSNKIDQLKLLLTYEHNDIHTLGISETKLNEKHPDAPFEISGYQKPFRCDRMENAGGVCWSM